MELTQRFLQSIECKKAGLKARRINLLFPDDHEVLKCMVYHWKLQESAIAKILEELNPKISIIDNNSALNMGDRIYGKLIEGLSTRPIPGRSVGPDSSKHRAQFSEVSGFVYCKVISRYHEVQI